MSNGTTKEPVNILLSREELLFVLKLLQADFLPGLDNDPLGQLTTEQQTLALTIAGRALQARELAHSPAQNEFVIHPNLLTAVGVCAYPERALLVYHWPAGQANPRRYFGYLRGPDIVAHTRPAEVLHLFSLLPSPEQLISQVLAVCEYADKPAVPGLELTVSSDNLAQARQWAESGQADKAIALLAGQAAPQAAQLFIETLAASPNVSIMQLLKQTEGGAAQQRDLTLVQNHRSTWLISATPGQTTLRVKTTNQTEIRALLAEWL